jgi:hypothetical protein
MGTITKYGGSDHGFGLEIDDTNLPPRQEMLAEMSLSRAAISGSGGHGLTHFYLNEFPTLRVGQMDRTGDAGIEAVNGPQYLDRLLGID